MKLIDLKGKKFGKLLVICRSEKESKLPLWECECECGKRIDVLGCNLRTGHTQSCGCFRKKIVFARSVKHGMSNNHLFGAWNTMKQRCSNTKCQKYQSYGGRGIIVCEEWKNSFQAFYDYVSKLPHFDEKGYSLDRINNDGNYEPGNVRWATTKDQNNNRRKRRIKEI